MLTKYIYWRALNILETIEVIESSNSKISFLEKNHDCEFYFFYTEIKTSILGFMED